MTYDQAVTAKHDQYAIRHLGDTPKGYYANLALDPNILDAPEMDEAHFEAIIAQAKRHQR